MPPSTDDMISKRVSTRRTPAQLTVCALLLLSILGTMLMIFLLSNESKEQSGNRSGGVTEHIAAIIVPDYEHLPADKQEQVLDRLHLPVRKMAHMGEYALLAILTGALLIAWNGRRRIHPAIRWGVPMAVCSVYASSDEIHQIFSNRGAAVTDVLIDCGGALLGLSLLWGLFALITRISRRPRA